MQLLIGADPELFVRDSKGFVSAHTMLPGTKMQPFPVPFGAVQVDGTAAEFNIDPASCEDEFVLHIHQVMGTLQGMLPVGVTLEVSAVAEYEPAYMTGLPEMVKKLGCDPDFNAYELEANDAPDQHPTMRTGAGHIHMGWGSGFNVKDRGHFEACAVLAKQLDFWLGLPSVLLDPDTKRKQMYGKAGCFRPKPYGMEYRVLSNFWLKDERLMRLVYANAKSAFETLVSGINLSEEYPTVARDAINNNWRTTAVKLCEDLDIPYRPELFN